MKHRLNQWWLILFTLLIPFGCQPPKDEAGGTAEEREYDLLQRKGQWAEIVEKDQQQPTQSAAYRNAVRWAKWHLGMIGQEELALCLMDSHGVLGSETAALMMSDIYLQLGMADMAQRAAFDAMVAMRSEKPCSRALKRLAEVAIITRQYDLAKKYIHIGEAHKDCRKWARQLRPLAEHPERIAEQHNYLKLREIYEKTNDEFFL